jgi:osmotically-inducible protein OsmY
MTVPYAARLIRSVAVLQAALCLYGYSTSVPAANADQQGDPQLVARVKEALAQDQRLYAAHINVSAEPDGVIHLSGIVASDDDLNQAKRDAKAVTGVRSVVEDLSIEGHAGR